jgi:hypothetical protein
MKTIALGMGPQVGTPEKIQKARTILSKLQGNASYPNPSPSLAELAAATDALETAYEIALDGSRSAKIILLQRESEFIRLWKLLAAYVLFASNGEDHIIASSGFENKSATKSPVIPGHPSNVRGTPTNRAGEVVVRWSKAAGVRIYTVQMSVDGLPWTPCGMTTKTRLVVSGLAGGSKRLFRVAAICANGQSDWSDPGAVNVH